MYLRKMKKLDNAIEEVYEMALVELEKLARTVLRSNDKSHYFLMAMGTHYFMDINRNILYDLPNQNKLDEFINEYNSFLGLTGVPMTFSVNGKIITDW